MQAILSLCKRSVIVAVLAITSLSIPLTSAVTYAADCTPPQDTRPGVHQPTGAESDAYTYVCDGQYANEYVSSKFVYNPADDTKTPLFISTYSYNCSTNRWMMTWYAYSPAINDYYQTKIAADTTPNQPTNCPIAATPAAGSASSTTTTGNGSTNTTSSGQNATVTGTNNNGYTMTNGVLSKAGSGNATVSGNTIGGSASTGDAQSVTNVANMLQTSSNVFGPNTATFTANINGDVTGDFMFDPSAIMDTGANSTNTSDKNSKLTVNQANNTDASINNTIDVNAQTGNATVNGNTQAGNATSGNATAVVNLMNLINSTVKAGQSFVGTININGNLNGDILLPPDTLNQLLASGNNSTNQANTTANVSGTATNNTNLGINNDITSTATTGTADVSGNTKAGSATSGNASTGVTYLNMTGSKVVGSKDLLVFVNVSGHWVGMIMNAPAGTTAASLGGGITDTGANSTNSTTNGSDVTANSTNNTNLGINNTVNATATSGDASVTNNTVGGSAKTGDAKTAVNVVNIAGSTIDLSGWFGVLFINVFGNWTGSFGVNTSAGDQPVTLSGTSPAAASAAQAVSKQFASFVARSSSTGSASATTTPASTQATPSATSSVLGASTKKAAKTLPTPDTETHASYMLPIIGVSIAAIMLIGERVVAARKK